MEDCLFCKIIAGEIPSSKVFENKNVYAFKDINPLAKEHYLLIHKKHTTNVNEMSQDPEQIADIFKAINEFTSNSALLENGYRIVTNVNQHGGQTVFHTHFHVLGGEQLKGFGS